MHLGSELFTSATGTQMAHVIYKETTQLYTSVATGELAFALGSSATAGPLQRANKLRFLAVAAPKRVAAFPEPGPPRTVPSAPIRPINRRKRST